MGLVRSFIGTDGIWQYIPHINTGLFSIIKVHFLLFANLIVDWYINTINFTDSGFSFHTLPLFHVRQRDSFRLSSPCQSVIQLQSKESADTVSAQIQKLSFHEMLC